MITRVLYFQFFTENILHSWHRYQQLKRSKIPGRTTGLLFYVLYIMCGVHKTTPPPASYLVGSGPVAGYLAEYLVWRGVLAAWSRHHFSGTICINMNKEASPA
jgi:hypothetical protein